MAAELGSCLTSNCSVGEVQGGVQLAADAYTGAFTKGFNALWSVLVLARGSGGWESGRT